MDLGGSTNENTKSAYATVYMYMPTSVTYVK